MTFPGHRQVALLRLMRKEGHWSCAAHDRAVQEGPIRDLPNRSYASKTILDWEAKGLVRRRDPSKPWYEAEFVAGPVLARELSIVERTSRYRLTLQESLE